MHAITLALGIECLLMLSWIFAHVFHAVITNHITRITLAIIEDALSLSLLGTFVWSILLWGSYFGGN